MMKKKYAVVIKTGDAELRAVENLPQATISSFLPIIEITRGRKIPDKTKLKLEATGEVNIDMYPFEKRFDRIKAIFKNQTVCIDLTTESLLSSQAIDELFDYNNGYKKGIDFLLKLKHEECFKEIIPCIIMNFDDPNVDENLILQIKTLCNNFDTICYRNFLTDEYCYNDIELIKDSLCNNANFIYMLDSGYIIPSSQNIFYDKIKFRISEMSKLVPANTQYIINATSFPKQVSDIGNDFTDSFKIIEKLIFKDLQTQFANLNLIYGDYGTINPIRNDDVIMARGWIPRIDVPIEDEVYYYRLRRSKGISQYKDTYVEVAKLAKNDSKFPMLLKENWGVSEIIRGADGKPSSSSPSFWISVRMNIHIQQQVNLL